ncbi:triple tyrosine motif-containing protein [Flavobacterium psychrotolerans]|uniref:Regulator n=1 Tax=Flavobacterium psychrotolerans TaxID=2169410 RepID=A0A2U1JGI0_9FLAO|nr:triple tyrosine motif-containing protein [Flavobacterium psychrotolerans]PWA03973.1 regulator [Flavobacterium psychrotolerans]
MNFKKILFHFLLLFFLKTTLSGQVKNIGLPEIRNYKRIDYKGGTQNWNIDQDKNGNLYFANNNGLFQFDGSSWHKYNLPNFSSLRCLKIDATGKIFVGGYNEFGYFKSDLKGNLEYFSLSKLLNENNIKAIDFIWKIHLFQDEVIFQSFKKVYIFKNNKIKLLKAPNRFQFSFQVKNNLYFQDVAAGILKYNNGKFFALEGSKALNNTEIWGMFPMNNDKILITTLDKGIFVYDAKKLISWNTPANEFVKKNNSLGGVSIKDKFFAFNSVLDGIIICDLSGKIIQHINRKNGLQNNTVLTSFIDNKNNLWLGLDNGIAFVNENSPFTYFGPSYGISTVYASVVYKGNLYVATNQGVFYHPWNTAFEEDTFALVEGTKGQAWNIQVIDGQLFCAHNSGALQITDNKSVRLLNTKGYWSFKKVPNNSNLMIGSNYNGFALFEKTIKGWQYKNQIERYDKSVTSFEIDGDYLWFIKDDILYQLGIDENQKQFKTIKTYKNLSSSAKGIGSVQHLINHVVFQKNNHFYKYSHEEDVFFEDKKTSNLFKNIPNIRNLNEDFYGNIWYFFDESLGVLMKDKNGTYKNVVAPFSNLTGNLVYNYESVNTIDLNSIFIGLTDGLAHYDSKALNNSVTRPKAFIRSFSFSNDTLIFGNGQNKIGKYSIPYNSNHVRFTFSAPIYENVENIKFSYQLEGFDDKWSNWSSISLKEYTNLMEGGYKMKVKVKNSYGVESEETIIPFTISPPWYRHFMAYVFYILSIVASIYFIRKRIKTKIRKNKYYETIEQRRLYLEKESKIRQEQYELEKEIEKLKNDKLQIKILLKDKELVNNTLQVVKKNKILNGIIQKLKDINVESFDESTKFQFTKLNKSIVKEVNADKSWKDLEMHIKNVHFDFLKRLKEKYPTISPRELDLSTYLLMNMSTKEITEIMNISRGGVELARYRLRKKLDLNKKENLIGFLMSI